MTNPPTDEFNKATKDQIAAVMLLHGTEEQRLEALRYALPRLERKVQASALISKAEKV